MELSMAFRSEWLANKMFYGAGRKKIDPGKELFIKSNAWAFSLLYFLAQWLPEALK